MRPGERGYVRGAAGWLALAAALACALVPGVALAGEASGTTTPTPDASPTPSPPPVATPSVEPTWTTVGYSVRGRPIQMISFGSGPRRVLIIGGIHGTEYGTPVARSLVSYLRANPSAVASGTQLDVIVCANPDGRAMHRGGNARNVDINRNFPARNWRRIRARRGSSGRRPASEPETRVLVSVLARRYARVVSLHSRGGVVDYDGPAGRWLATRVARRAGMPVIRLARYKRYPGSLGSYVPPRYRIPVITIELRSRTLTTRLRSGLLVVVN